LKKKKIDKKPKKGWFLQKHTGLKSRLDESLTKTIKYKYFQNQKQNKYAYKNSTEIILKPRRKKEKKIFYLYKEMIFYLSCLIEYVSFTDIYNFSCIKPNMPSN